MATEIPSPVPQPPIAAAAEQEAWTRWKAQKHFGLVGKIDWLLGGVMLAGVLGTILCAILPFVSLMAVLIVVGITLLFAAVWIIILLYRTLIFVLDLHADVALMPESAARIVAGFFEGRKR